MILLKRKNGKPILSDFDGVGQPIVDLSTGDTYVKTSNNSFKVINDNNNIKNDEGQDSVTLKYSGEVDSTHFPSSTTGNNDACLGEANTSSGKRNIISGKLNNITGHNNIVGGLKNNVGAVSAIIAGESNENSYSYGINIGKGLIAYADSQALFGEYNRYDVDLALAVGNGASDNRKNAFEVYKDGTIADGKGEIDIHNLIDGDGTDSIVMKYSGNITETEFANTTTGANDTVLGLSNTSTGKRNVIAGKLNQVTTSNNVIGGLRNIVSAGHSNVIGGEGNEISGDLNIVSGYHNIVNSGFNLVSGSGNDTNGKTQVGLIGSDLIAGLDRQTVIGIHNEENNLSIFVVGNGYVDESSQSVNRNALTVQYNGSTLVGYMHSCNDNNCLLAGEGLGSLKDSQTVVGKYNALKNNALFIVGNGSNNYNRSNIFEVLEDGRAKVYGAPVESNDVIRFLDITNSINPTLSGAFTQLRCTGLPTMSIDVVRYGDIKSSLVASVSQANKTVVLKSLDNTTLNTIQISYASTAGSLEGITFYA